MADWHDFFIAEVGASAAFAGLLFVALSINIQRIIDGSGLASRAAQSFVMLMAALTIASLALFPHMTPTSFGIAVIVAAAVSAIAAVRLTISQLEVEPEYRRYVILNAVMNGIFYALEFLGAGLAVAGVTGIGLTLLALSILYALCNSMFNAWVLLVEILR